MYIAEVLYLENHIYVIQFFLKCHRLSDFRFNILLKANDNTHVFLLLNTLVNISLDIIKADPLASFGFMGASTRKEASSKNAANINPDNTVKNTKRYRNYSLYVKRYYPPGLFLHIEYKDSSCYLLRNNFNEQLTEKRADDYLNEIIDRKINMN